MKMISIATRRQNSLSLSGGGIVSEQLVLPSYSPNAVSPIEASLPWGEEVVDINTPDIDPSFFDNGPFFKKNDNQSALVMDFAGDENPFFTTTDQMTYSSLEDTNQTSIEPSLEENFDFSSMISQTPMTEEFKEDSFVSPNDVLQNTYIGSAASHTKASVPQYLELRTIGSTVNIDVITTPNLIEALSSQSSVDSFPSTIYSSPSHSTQQSYSAVTTHYARPTPSPALSYTSTASSPSNLVSNIDSITSDATIDSLIETKPDPEFLQPTVINDHLYSTPTTSSSRKRKSSGKSDPREKNNEASKKSRTTKRDKQKQMDEQIRRYEEENPQLRRQIEQMEREIKWCKDYLFKKVVPNRA